MPINAPVNRNNLFYSEEDYELETELFLNDQKLNQLLPNRGDVKYELEDHKTVSEE